MGYSLAVVASAGAARSRAVVALAGASAFLLKPFFFFQLTKLLRLIRGNIVSPERGRRDFKSPESEPT